MLNESMDAMKLGADETEQVVGGFIENHNHRVVCRNCPAVLRDGFRTANEAFLYAGGLHQKCPKCSSQLYVEAYEVFYL